MASRLKLHEELIDILGTENVYFRPPSSEQMRYDAIVYSMADPNLKRANDGVYLKTNRYDGTVITYDPDSAIPDAILHHFQMCSLGRPYVVDNLNHFPFTIYY